MDRVTVVTVMSSDWGSGATGNAPDDVNGSTAWGAGSSFTCGGGACR